MIVFNYFFLHIYQGVLGFLGSNTQRIKKPLRIAFNARMSSRVEMCTAVINCDAIQFEKKTKVRSKTCT
jgi:hypothetical protein